MRRVLPQVLAALLLLSGGLAIPAAAAATPPRASAPADCPKPQPYPPVPNATVESSTTDPQVGDTIKASGVHYCADEDVRLTIGATFVGMAHTDAQGEFDPQVVVPKPAGTKQLCGAGASGLSSDADCLTLTVKAAGAGNASPSSGAGTNSGGGTAFTGVEISILIAVALILVAGGLAFSTAGRNRKSVPQA
jgi:hypothetical protein